MPENTKEIAFFHVHVTSLYGGTWQGMVGLDGELYPFRSELELLDLVMEHFPGLRPDAVWENSGKSQEKSDG